MTTHEREMWDMIYNSLDDYLGIGEKSLKLWFGEMELRYLTENAAYFSIDNYNKQQIIYKIYMDGFKTAVKNVLGFEPAIHIICVEKESFEDQFADIIYSEINAVKEDCHVSAQNSNASQLKEESNTLNTDTNSQENANSTQNETVLSDVINKPVSEKEIPDFDDFASRHAAFANPSKGNTMQGFKGIDPEEVLRKTNLESVPIMADKSMKLRMQSAPKRYNSENDTIETVPLSKYYDDLKSKNGIMILSPGAPLYNVDYTFENFVVGDSNKYAYHYCYQVSQYPARQYNPLFIYGNPGLGKTHLLYSITHEIEKLHPSLNIVYIKGDDFTNELVEAIASKNTQYFRDKYRNADIFLMDDVQFIAGKPSTQSEFFHTYESLFQTGKQIIMTSDVAPKNIVNLEERLRSRFESGIVVGIDAPDTELRTAIFKNKASSMGISIPNDILIFLAQSIKDNVRQIEGVLKKISSMSMLENRPIDMELARRCISDIADVAVTINETVIINAVSEKYGIEVDALLSKKKTKEISYARHIAVYLIRKLIDLSLPDIGKIFNRDHTTIMNSIERIKCELEDSPQTKKDIDSLIEIIRTKR